MLPVCVTASRSSCGYRLSSTGHELAFLNAVDAIRSLAQVAIPRRQVEVVRTLAELLGGETDRRRVTGRLLVHTPETWCRIALLFAGPPSRRDADTGGAPDLDASRADAPARHEAARGRSSWHGPAICGVRSTAGVAVLKCRVRMPYSSSMPCTGDFLAALQSGPVVSSTVLRICGYHPGTIQSDGAGRWCMHCQENRSCPLSPLADC